MLKLHLYPHYEYSSSPLVFVALPDALTAAQKCALLSFLNTEGYGCTLQDTPYWAPEYELWVRNVLANAPLSYLPVNPCHLDMCSQMVNGICEILGNTSRNAMVFSACVNNQTLVELINTAFTHNPDICEYFSVDETTWTICEADPDNSVALNDSGISCDGKGGGGPDAVTQDILDAIESELTLSGFECLGSDAAQLLFRHGETDRDFRVSVEEIAP